MDTLVSILIPAYNADRWLADTIRSALGQTWKNKEIVIVDDGSTDRTLSIARQFASPSLRVVTQPNQGAAAARNRALSLSQGGYIQWLDADDLLAPDKIQKQMEARRPEDTERTLLSASWGSFRHRSDRAKFTATALWTDLSPAEWLMRKIGQNLYMQTSTWLVSRTLTEAAGPWDTRLIGDDDGEYFCRVLLASDYIRFVPQARVFYRQAGVGSVSYLGRSRKKLDAHLLSMKLHVKYLQSIDDSERARTACANYLETWSICFYPEQPDLLAEVERLAATLGRPLPRIQLSWKYEWIRRLFGWRIAKQAWLRLPVLKWSFVALWDKALFRLDEWKEKHLTQ
jgi:glycosyltransferase involved in cell wall biosynthesis